MLLALLAHPIFEAPASAKEDVAAAVDLLDAAVADIDRLLVFLDQVAQLGERIDGRAPGGVVDLDLVALGPGSVGQLGDDPIHIRQLVERDLVDPGSH